MTDYSADLLYPTGVFLNNVFSLKQEVKTGRTVKGLTCSGIGGVTGEGRLRAGDWFCLRGGDCGDVMEVVDEAEPGEGTEMEDCCWLGEVM